MGRASRFFLKDIMNLLRFSSKGVRFMPYLQGAVVILYLYDLIMDERFQRLSGIEGLKNEYRNRRRARDTNETYRGSYEGSQQC